MIRQAADISTLPDPAEATHGQLLRWLVGAAIAFLPVQIEVASDLRIAPSDLFLALAVVLGLGVWRGVRNAWSIWHVGLLAMFFVWIYAKGFRSGELTQFDLVNKLTGIVVLYAFYVCLTTLASEWVSLRWFMKVYVISVAGQNAVVCVAFLWCRHTGSQDPILIVLLSDGVDRLAGMLVDANAYGGLLAVAFGIALLAGDSEEPLLPRWLRLACLASLAIGLLLTSSRSAWIGVGLVAMVAALRNPRLIVILAVLVIGGAGVVALSIGSDQFDQFLTVSSRQNTIDERVEISQNAWQMFLDNPLLGAGIGRFYEDHGIIVHNSALWFLAEFGLFGFCVYAGFMGWFLVKGYTASRNVGADQASLIIGLLAAHLAMIGLSMGIEALYQRYWWMTMGLVASAHALAVREAAGALEPARDLPTHPMLATQEGGT